MRKSLTLFLASFIGISFIVAQENYTAQLNTDIDSLSYSLGLLIGNNLAVQGVKHVNPAIYMKGLQDGFISKAVNLTFEQANMYIQAYFDKQMVMKADENLKAGLQFLAENGKQEGVVTLESGLQYKVLNAGEGPSPKVGDQVKVHYRGTLIDGSEFDSSYERGEPAEFGVNQVIKGWTEALTLMSPGSKWMLYIPASLAYGADGAGDVIGPNSTLIFEVELLEVIRKQ